MRTFFAIFFGVAVIAATAGVAGASTYEFEDIIDTWGAWDATRIKQGTPLSFSHDLNDDVDFAGGDFVTAAWLELDFTNDLTDSTKLWGVVKWDFEEYATLGFDGTGWVNLGEVDNGQYDLVLNVEWLNDDGFLDVVIDVSNYLGNATGWVDHSRVYGQAQTAPSPEPGTIVLLGGSCLFVAAYHRMRRKKCES